MEVHDADWSNGRTWSLVYTAGAEHEAVVRAAYDRFATTNALSPSAFPSLARMEREVVQALLDLAGGDHTRAGGTMASGGTESIILAVKAHRDRARTEEPSSSRATQPTMVIPSTAHPAFTKAGQLLGVEPIVVPVDSTLVADVGATAAAIDDRTLLLAASAPAFPYGLVDPIPELGAVALQADIGLHVDACLGAVALAVLPSLGHRIPPFDLSVAGVTSMSADLHKYGYGPKGSSTVLYQDRSLRRYQFSVYPDWPGGALASPTLLGTRPGGSIAAAWAALNHLGMDGYRAIFAELMDTTTRLRAGIEAIGDLRVIGQPPMMVFAFGSDTTDVFAIADDLETKGWRIDRQTHPDCLHLIVNPTHTAIVQDFLADLSEAYERAPRSDPANRVSAIYGVTSHIPLDTTKSVSDSLLDQIEDRYDSA